MLVALDIDFFALSYNVLDTETGEQCNILGKSAVEIGVQGVRYSYITGGMKVLFNVSFVCRSLGFGFDALGYRIYWKGYIYHVTSVIWSMNVDSKNVVLHVATDMGAFSLWNGQVIVESNRGNGALVDGLMRGDVAMFTRTTIMC